MKRTSSVLLILLLSIAVPTPLLAKGQIVKIAITGADLMVPIEITEFGNLKDVDVNVWAGPGVRINGKVQTEGFIIDWPRGAAADHPSGLQQYEVAFYAKLDEVRLVYVVSYDFSPSFEQGYIYLPGRHDKWFNLNCGTICHGNGFEGNWFRATKAWDSAARSLISRAKMTPSSGISLSQDQQDSRKTQKCKADAQRHVELVNISRLDDGLHLAAAANHGYYLESDDGSPWNRASSLEDLVHGSREVFVGAVRTAKASWRNTAGTSTLVIQLRSNTFSKGAYRRARLSPFFSPGETSGTLVAP
jgi:hypothetical protein